MAWCWIGDGELVGPQYVYQTMKHGGGSCDDFGMYYNFWVTNMV